MVDAIDVEHAKYQIARAEARLRCQLALIRELPSDADTRFVLREKAIVVELQEHVAAALAYHAHIVEELRFNILIYGNVINSQHASICNNGLPTGRTSVKEWGTSTEGDG